MIYLYVVCVFSCVLLASSIILFFHILHDAGPNMESLMAITRIRSGGKRLCAKDMQLSFNVLTGMGSHEAT